MHQPRHYNRRKRISRVWAAIAGISLCAMLSPFFFEDLISFDNGGGAMAFIGFLGAVTGIIVSVMYGKMGKAEASILDSIKADNVGFGHAPAGGDASGDGTGDSTGDANAEFKTTAKAAAEYVAPAVAHWEYDRASWERFVAAVFVERKKETGTTFKLIALVTAIALIPAAILTEPAFAVLFCAGLLAFLFGISRLVPIVQNARLRIADRSVFIST